MSAKASTVDKAQKEGRVLVYGTVELDEFSGWKKSFEKKYPGVEVEYKREYVPGTPPPMAKKIMEEDKAGKETADAVIKAQDRHLKDAVEGGDDTHATAFKAMKGRWKHPISGMGWYRATKREFAALPED